MSATPDDRVQGARRACSTAVERTAPADTPVLWHGPDTAGREADVRLPVAIGRGRHQVALTLGLAGVTTLRNETEVDFA